MAEPLALTSASIKLGTMIATSSMATNLIIFQDPCYICLAIIGAIVSMFGVVHEVYGEHTKDYTAKEIAAEVVKGVALGFLAIPFWYLTITEGLLQNLVGLNVGQVSNSLALIVAFGLSWYTIPVFNTIASSIKGVGASILKKWGS